MIRCQPQPPITLMNTKEALQSFQDNTLHIAVSSYSVTGLKTETKTKKKYFKSIQSKSFQNFGTGSEGKTILNNLKWVILFSAISSIRKKGLYSYRKQQVFHFSELGPIQLQSPITILQCIVQSSCYLVTVTEPSFGWIARDQRI